jgi:hypothetical protein
VIDTHDNWGLRRPGGIVKAAGLGDGDNASQEDHRQAAFDDATLRLIFGYNRSTCSA